MRPMIINKIMMIIMAGLTAAIMTACSGDEGGGGGGGGGAGSSTIDITSVADGATVGLNTIIRTTVSNAANVSKVEFYVDGTLYYTSVGSPFQFNLYTGDLLIGTTIEIQAIVYGTDNTTNDDTVASLVVDNQAPAVNITAPGAGAIANGSAVTITTEAFDNSNIAVDVDRVELYVDEQILASIPAGTGAGPFTYEITNWDTTALGDGSHVIKAVAYDAGGNRAIDEVAVTTDNGNPVVDISSPANGAIVKGASALIKVSASDADGIAQVELFIDGSTEGTAVMLPYQFIWDTTAETNGSHTILVTATDEVGNNGSDTITVIVDNAAPAVTITAPADASPVSGSRAITAAASDNYSLTSVKFYIDGILVATDTAAPYTLTWDTASWSDGGHSIKAIATDAGGLAAEDIISVTVDNNGPYNVKLISPQASDTVSGVITLTATALDYAGTINYVQFLLDGSIDLGNGTPNAGAYDLNWDSFSTSDGQHGMTIIAYDNEGNFTTNNTATFWVDNTNPAGVNITNLAVNENVSGTVNISVTASDAGVGIDYIEVTAGTTTGYLYHLGGTSYEFQWDTTGEANGINTITVTAHDLLGGTTNASVNVDVDNTLPTGVNVTSHSDGDYDEGTITIEASAADADSGIARVDFYIDGSLYSQDISVPYQATWATTPADNGPHSIKIIAYDNAGNQVTDNDTTIIVDNTAPTISISNPTTGAYVKGTITLSASVSDNSAVDRVEFEIDGTPRPAITSFPYEDSWVPANGDYDVSATVYDEAGNTGTAAQFTVHVDNTDPDPVDIAISPAFLNANDLRDTVTVQATATDGQTNITKVRFSIDGPGTNDVEYTDVSAPFEYSWNTDPAFDDGEYTITATSYDSAGNSSNATTGDTAITVDNEDPVIATAFAIDDDDGLADTGDYITTASVNLSNDVTDNENVYQMRFSNSGVAGTWSGWEAYAASRSGWDMTSATYGGTNTDGTKTVYVEYRDNAGNTVNTSDTIFLDRVDPIAGAGADDYFNVATNLSGTSSDPGANPSGVATVQWTVDSGPGAVTFNPVAANTGNTVFTSATVEGYYTLLFTVTDNAGRTNTDPVDICWDVTPPLVSAGASPVLLGPDMADSTLNGSSSDPNGASASGIFSQVWSLQSGPGGSYTLNTSTPYSDDDPDFVTATVDGDYILRYTVTDNAGNSAYADKTVTWDDTDPSVSISPTNPIPSSHHNSAITLDATCTDTHSMTYLWTYSTGTGGTVSFVGNTAMDPTCTMDTDGDYTLRITATDEAGNSAYAEVTVTWDDTDPTANAGSDSSESTTFTLDGTGSSDNITTTPNLLYTWSSVSGPTTPTITSPNSSTTSCSMNINGTYVIGLTVEDEAGNTNYDEVTITWEGSIDPSGNSIGEYSSIDMVNDGTNNYVFVSYYDSDNGDLRLATASDSDSWATWQIVDDVDTTGDVGQYTAIKAKYINDGTNNYFIAYITYYDATTRALKFANVKSAPDSHNFSTPTITLQPIDTSPDANPVGQYSSISVRVDGTDSYAYVSYYDGSDTSLRFAWATHDESTGDWNGAWTNNVEVDNTANVGQYTSVTHVLSGSIVAVYISYYDVDNGNLKFARDFSDANIFNTWATVLTVDNDANDVGKYSSIDSIIDTVARAYISYYDDTTDTLKFAYATASDWNSWTTVSSIDSPDVGLYTDISVVPGTPVNAYISYYDFANTALKFASGNSTNWTTSWTTDTIDFGGVDGDVGLYSSIRAYNTSDIYISYYDQTGKQIKFVYTTTGGAPWLYP